MSAPLGEPAPARLVAAVERARGERFTEAPRIVVVDRATLRTEADAALDAVLPAETARGEARVLAALGLVPAGYDLREGARSLLSDRLAALYDPEREAIVVPAGETPSDEVLAHELAHALQHQRHGRGFEFATWSEAFAAHELSDRALAHECLREGEAEFVAARALGYEGSFRRRAGTPLTAAPRDLPPWLRLHLSAPYTQGAFLIERLLDRGGWQAVDGLWGGGMWTGQVLEPEQPAPSAGLPLPLPEAAPKGALTLGELGLRALFELLDANPHAEACAGWAGDVAAIYERDGRDVFLWRLRFESAADALEFQEDLDALRRRGGPSLRDGELTRHGQDVLLIDAASPDASARLREALLGE